jgi:acetoin utilization deacetylase AcuC-like enzyme
MAAMPLVWSDDHRLHEPSAELWLGVRTPAVELPVRAEAIRAALEAAGHPVVAARPQPDAALEAVHDPALLAFLAGAYADWTAAGLHEDPGQPEVIPYFFAHPGLLGPHAPALPVATWARTGAFAFDTMTPIGPGTWRAARAGADAALTAAGLVLAGAPAAYACTRPPGHHVTRSAYGGCCYLNNAAIAAAALHAALGGPVALLDLDAHHGNGAQAIFYADAGVRTGSVHVDPGHGWFPHFLGFAGEDGAAAGLGANRNLPLAPGTGDAGWVAAVEDLAAWAAGARALVVALGVDAAAGDAEAPLAVTADGFRAAGRALGALGVPTVMVQEGGYDVDAIGALVRAALQGIDEGQREVEGG